MNEKTLLCFPPIFFLFKQNFRLKNETNVETISEEEGNDG